MSGFDHDAAMRRGADRQELVDKLMTHLYDFADTKAGRRPTADMWLAELHIAVLTTIKSQEGYPRGALFPSQEREVREFVQQIEAEVEKFASDRLEQRMMMLTLSDKLCQSACAQIVSEFSSWESQIFREKAAK